MASWQALTTTNLIRNILKTPYQARGWNYPWMIISVEPGSEQSRSIQLSQLTLLVTTAPAMGTVQLPAPISRWIYDSWESQYNDPLTCTMCGWNQPKLPLGQKISLADTKRSFWKGCDKGRKEIVLMRSATVTWGWLKVAFGLVYSL